ncbi:unnamed protein product [Schistosoma margrebowiei]|uniref:Uncharacterized protein n=1 Tax=Schistosoma margrebowiei TaxID=48269 RepID=A0AA84ZFN0_9TREM|nr:unnamed protein product [Schistosoma margrebowiei]
MGKDEITALLSVIHAPSIRFLLMTTAIVFFVTCKIWSLTYKPNCLVLWKNTDYFNGSFVVG